MPEINRWVADPELTGRTTTPAASSCSTTVAAGDPVYRWQASLLARLTARLRMGHFDRLLVTGTTAPMGSALEVHAVRLISIKEREAVARTLLRAVREHREGVAPLIPAPTMSARVPFHRANIATAIATIETLTLRLHSPRPVTAPGMARLRLLLTDGVGPFYQHGRGDLQDRLDAALAAL
jgi:hypothetical protein